MQVSQVTGLNYYHCAKPAAVQNQSPTFTAFKLEHIKHLPKDAFLYDFENVGKLLEKKLKADPLFDKQNHLIAFSWSRFEEKIKYIPDGIGITGIKKKSNSPYIPTEFEYGQKYREIPYKEPHLNMYLLDEQDLQVYMQPWKMPQGYKLFSCDFMYNNDRTTEQIAEDLYNTYKHLRYEKYYNPKNK